MVCELDRLCSHTSSDDHRVYRPETEIAEMMGRDPIQVVANELISAGELTEEAWEEIKQKVNKQVDEEYQRAESEPDPHPDDVMDQVFGEIPVAEAPPIQGGRRMRIVDALKETFHAALERDDRTVVVGRDRPVNHLGDSRSGPQRDFEQEPHAGYGESSPIRRALAEVICAKRSRASRPVGSVNGAGLVRRGAQLAE